MEYLRHNLIAEAMNPGRENPLAAPKVGVSGGGGGYDKDLQMFIQGTREFDQKKLEALRWRVENGRLGERPLLERPSGFYAKEYGYEDEQKNPLYTSVTSKLQMEQAGEG